MTDLTISFWRLTSFVKFYISDRFWHFCTKLQKEGKKETAFGGPLSGAVLSASCLLSPDVVFNIPSVIWDIFNRMKNCTKWTFESVFFKLIWYIFTENYSYLYTWCIYTCTSMQFQTTYSKNKKEKNGEIQSQTMSAEQTIELLTLYRKSVF